MIDLFGNTIDDRLPGGPMCQRFIEPPFTILDGRSDRWQARKRDWIALGIQSEIGRDVSGRSCTGVPLAESLASDLGPPGVMIGGRVKEYDPTLCELVYSWFMPKNPDAGILDPFAGGSVRGIVAARLGCQYTGVDLRVEQVEANVLQSLQINCHPKPIWIKGDSAQIESLVGNRYDLLFTCPPYWNLERYSDLDSDLSTLDNWDDFAASRRRGVKEKAWFGEYEITAQSRYMFAGAGATTARPRTVTTTATGSASGEGLCQSTK